MLMRTPQRKNRPSKSRQSQGRPQASRSQASPSKTPHTKSSYSKSPLSKSPHTKAAHSKTTRSKVSYSKTSRSQDASEERLGTAGRPQGAGTGRSKSAGRFQTESRSRVVRPRTTTRRRSSSAEGGEPGPDRLQKVLAAAGLGSRRKCEELITTGRVEIDRKVVVELGTRVDRMQHEVRVDGVPLPRPKLVYFAVNKPIGVVSTNRDPSGRPRVIDLVPPKYDRLFAIGRLDITSEGLILVTNDGDLANHMTHPRYGVSKTYRVTVAGFPERDVLEKLTRGIHLAEGVARAERVTIKSHHKESTVMEMVLREGKNREIRRALARVGHKVLHLARIAVGPIRLGDLPVGACRQLTREEVATLRRGPTAAE
jgi:23S rRNA pseudouridine2605 synthase